MFNPWKQRVVIGSVGAALLLVSPFFAPAGVAYAGGAGGPVASPTSNSSGPPNTITVTGAASLTVQASIAQLNFGMSVNDSTPQKLDTDLQHLRHALLAHLAQVGVPAGDVVVSTTGYNSGNVNPSMQLNLVVTVVNSDAKVAAVMDAVTKVSPTYLANNYTSMQYYPEYPSLVRSKLFAAALADARAQATLLAQATGESVGAVNSVAVVTQPYYVQTTPYPYLNSSSIGGIQISSYNQSGPTVMVQLTVTFDLVPAQGQ